MKNQVHQQPFFNLSHPYVPHSLLLCQVFIVKLTLQAHEAAVPKGMGYGL